jgi:hypothetical protein
VRRVVEGPVVLEAFLKGLVVVGGGARNACPAAPWSKTGGKAGEWSTCSARGAARKNVDIVKSRWS